MNHLCLFVPLRSTDGVVQLEYGECLMCGQCEYRDPPHYGYSTTKLTIAEYKAQASK
jgi:hypothetical protein